MSLYPTTLFHFTEKEHLYSILSDTFKTSYAREKIIGPANQREFAVPMVSFCDLKISELKYFLKYGKYGIGLTKDWANQNGLSPVMYVNRHCEMMDNLIDGITGIYAHIGKIQNMKQNNEVTKSYLNIMNTYRYIKNYQGELWRNGILEDDNYRFADEREWRFVPGIETKDVLPFIAISNIKTRKQKEESNKKIEHLKLTFKPDDIKYLIVENEDEITPLIEHLHHAKERFNEETRNRLASRIFTVDQIKNDV